MPRARPPLAPAVLHDAAQVIKCLGHPLRLRLLEAMEYGEHSVSELQEATGTGQAAVSEQLGILRAKGVVAARREGPFVLYHITEPKVRRILACIRACDTEERRPTMSTGRIA